MSSFGAFLVVGIAAAKVFAEIDEHFSKNKAYKKINEQTRFFKEGFDKSLKEGTTVEEFIVDGEIESKDDFSSDDLSEALYKKMVDRCQHEYHRDDVVPVVDDLFITSYQYDHVPWYSILPREQTNLYGLRRFHCRSAENTAKN